MEIEFREYGSPKVKTRSLSNIVTEEAPYGRDDIIERLNAKAMAAIEFTEKVVDLLHAKGLLNDNDIATLVSRIACCNKDSVKVLPE